MLENGFRLFEFGRFLSTKVGERVAGGAARRFHGGARTAARRWTRGARRYAYEVEAEAAAEAVDLFPRLRRWYQGDRGPFPADASALRGWPHYAPLRKAFLLERERADAAEAAKRRREAAEERVRSKREAESLAAAAAEAKSATLVGGVADDDDDAADAAPTRRTALAKGTLILIKGLTKNADLNGRSGVIAAEYDEVKGRYAVAFADKSYTIRWQNVDVHPAQKLRDKLPKGDEVVFVSEEEQREGMHARPRLEREDGAPTPIKKKRSPSVVHRYAVKLDPQFFYDKAIDRVLAASNEFEVLDLPAEPITEMTVVKRQSFAAGRELPCPSRGQRPPSDAAKCIGFRLAESVAPTFDRIAATRPRTIHVAASPRPVRGISTRRWRRDRPLEYPRRTPRRRRDPPPRNVRPAAAP